MAASVKHNSNADDSFSATGKTNWEAEHIVNITAADIGAGDVVWGGGDATPANFAAFDDTTGKIILDSGTSPAYFATAVHTHHGEIIEPNVVALQTDIATPPTNIGSIYWDSQHHTASLITSADTNLQIGQENVILCLNNTASTISNGKVVRVSGAGTGTLKDRPTIALAQANAENTSYMLGVATQDILAGNEGFITTLGTVNDVDCSSYNTGDLLWLSATIAGGLTATKPDAPNHANYVARALNNKNANAGGAIFVSPLLGYELDELHDVATGVVAYDLLQRNAANTLWEPKSLAEIGVASHASSHIADTGSDPLHAVDVNAMAYHGWLARSMAAGTTPATKGQLPVQITTTTFTLYASRVNVTYYYQGTKVVVTTDKTTTLDDGAGGSTAGLYYIYFNAATGNIANSKSFPGVTNTANVLIATVTWNGTNLGHVNDERHGYMRNGIWHLWAHQHVGTVYGSGITLTTANSGAGLTFATTSGEIDDEDISFLVDPSSAFPTPNTCRIVRQTSATTYIIEDAVSTWPFKWNGSTTRVQYVNAAAPYALVDANSARYVNTWIYATTDLHTPIYAVVETIATATTGYTSVANARAILPPSLSELQISHEMKLLYRLILTGAGTVSEMTDYRNSSPLPAGGAASTTAAAVGYSPTAPITNVTVQGALDQVANAAQNASTTLTGLLSSTDWNTFNGKMAAVTPGTAGNVLTSNGATWESATPSATGQSEGAMFFTATIDYTIPETGTYRIGAIGAGGGGAGGSATTCSTTGGGGGGFCERTDTITAGEVIHITIGAGGNGGGAGAAGSAGGSTTVEYTDSSSNARSMSASGGGGGRFVTTNGQTAASASGGTASGGSIMYSGGASGACFCSSGSLRATGGGASGSGLGNGGQSGSIGNVGAGNSATGGGAVGNKSSGSMTLSGYYGGGAGVGGNSPGNSISPGVNKLGASSQISNDLVIHSRGNTAVSLFDSIYDPFRAFSGGGGTGSTSPSQSGLAIAFGGAGSGGGAQIAVAGGACGGNGASSAGVIQASYGGGGGGAINATAAAKGGDGIVAIERIA